MIQVVFQDSSELILSSGQGDVTFITSRKEVWNSPLYQDLEKEDPSLFKRLNYAKEILVGMINPQKQKQEVNEENFNPWLSTGISKSNFPLSATKTKSKERLF